MDFIDQLNAEIARMTIENFIALSLMFVVPFYFSKKAQTLFFHLLYSFLGLYMIFFTQDVRILNDPKLLVGLGLILPQISFMIQFVKDVIFTIKMMSANTYYFFVTIYYKIQRFISWIQDIILMFKSFGNRRKENSDYKEESHKQKQRYNNTYEDSSYKQNSSYNQDYKKQEESYTNYQEEQSSYKQEDISYQEQKQDYREFERFYSPSAYIVLGVSESDDFSDIKKAYRKLVRVYHPDLNPNEIELYTELTQNINSAYEKLQKIHA